jgi:hypothetical protein
MAFVEGLDMGAGKRRRPEYLWRTNRIMQAQKLKIMF